MEISIVQQPSFRVAAVRHTGPYHGIGAAFQKLDRIVAALDLGPGAILVALYHDDPSTTPPEKLRSDAGVVIPIGAPVPEGLTERMVPEGAYAGMAHVGSYRDLPRAWQQLREWVAKNGRRSAGGTSYEKYLNTPANAKEEDLRTELYLPVK